MADQPYDTIELLPINRPRADSPEALRRLAKRVIENDPGDYSISQDIANWLGWTPAAWTRQGQRRRMVFFPPGADLTDIFEMTMRIPPWDSSFDEALTLLPPELRAVTIIKLGEPKRVLVEFCGREICAEARTLSAAVTAAAILVCAARMEIEGPTCVSNSEEVADG